MLYMHTLLPVNLLLFIALFASSEHVQAVHGPSVRGIRRESHQTLNIRLEDKRALLLDKLQERQDGLISALTSLVGDILFSTITATSTSTSTSTSSTTTSTDGGDTTTTTTTTSSFSTSTSSTTTSTDGGDTTTTTTTTSSSSTSTSSDPGTSTSTTSPGTSTSTTTTSTDPDPGTSTSTTTSGLLPSLPLTLPSLPLTVPSSTLMLTLPTLTFPPLLSTTSNSSYTDPDPGTSTSTTTTTTSSAPQISTTPTSSPVLPTTTQTTSYTDPDPGTSTSTTASGLLPSLPLTLPSLPLTSPTSTLMLTLPTLTFPTSTTTTTLPPPPTTTSSAPQISTTPTSTPVLPTTTQTTSYTNPDPGTSTSTTTTTLPPPPTTTSGAPQISTTTTSSPVLPTTTQSTSYSLTTSESVLTSTSSISTSSISTSSITTTSQFTLGSQFSFLTESSLLFSTQTSTTTTSASTTLTNPDQAKTTIGVQSGSNPPSATAPFPSSLPTLITPSPPLNLDDPTLNSDYTLVSIQFIQSLNWPFVASQPASVAQIMAYMPAVIEAATGVTQDEVKTYALKAWSPVGFDGDASELLTVWLAFVPNDIVSELAAELPIATSPLYKGESGIAEQLASLINGEFPVLADSSSNPLSGSKNPGGSGNGGGNGNGDLSGGSAATARRNAIVGVCVAFGVLALGVAIWWVLRATKRNNEGAALAAAASGTPAGYGAMAQVGPLPHAWSGRHEVENPFASPPASHHSSGDGEDIIGMADGGEGAENRNRRSFFYAEDELRGFEDAERAEQELAGLGRSNSGGTGHGTGYTYYSSHRPASTIRRGQITPGVISAPILRESSLNW